MSDDTWKTVRVPVRRLLREHDFEEQHYYRDWITAPIAPLASTLAAARSRPGARYDALARTVCVDLDDGSICYGFDAGGRMVSADYDPTADSSVYRFAYRYDDCS